MQMFKNPVRSEDAAQKPAYAEKLPNAIVPDTNVLIHDPEAVDLLREDGNVLFIPSRVLIELDKLKRQPMIGRDAGEALARINELHSAKDPTLVIARNFDWSHLKGLDKKYPDIEIIAAAASIVKENKRPVRFREVKLLSRDNFVQINAREYVPGLVVEDYCRDKTAEAQGRQPEVIDVHREEIGQYLTFPSKDYPSIGINEGVICNSNCSSCLKEEPWGNHFAAICKGDHFKIIPPEIFAFGLAPMSLNGNGPNWGQHIALAQLLDPSIELVILQGGAGTGKRFWLWRPLWSKRAILPKSS